MSKVADLNQLLTKSQQLFKQRRCREALAVLDQALALAPNTPAAWSLKGRNLLLRCHADALVSFDEAIQGDSTCVDAYVERGEALCELNHYDEALASCEHVIELDAANAWALACKGMAL